MTEPKKRKTSKKTKTVKRKAPVKKPTAAGARPARLEMRISAEVRARLVAEAARTRRTISSVAHEALERVGQ